MTSYKMGSGRLYIETGHAPDGLQWAEVVGITPPTSEVETIHFDAAGCREFVQGLRDGGDVAVDVTWTTSNPAVGEFIDRVYVDSALRRAAADRLARLRSGPTGGVLAYLDSLK